MDLPLVDLRPPAMVAALALTLGSIASIAGCSGKVEADPPTPPSTSLPIAAQSARGPKVEGLSKPPVPALAPTPLVPITPSGTPTNSGDAGPPVETP